MWPWRPWGAGGWEGEKAWGWGAVAGGALGRLVGPGCLCWPGQSSVRSVGTHRMPDAAAEALSPGLVVWTEADGTPPPPPCRPHCHPSPQPPLSPGHTQASEHAHNRRGHNCQHPWSHGPSTALTLITSPCALSPMQPLPHHYSPSPTTAALPLGHLLLFTPFY